MGKCLGSDISANKNTAIAIVAKECNKDEWSKLTNLFDGKDIYKVQIKENSFRFYEADTGLLIMTEETTVAMGNEIKTITKFSDYKEVDGVKYAFKREIITGPQTIVIEADQVILNEEIEDDFFN